MKLPAIQFYTGDWRKDPGIQALDFETRGIWFEMLCLMNESEDRGKLMLNGAPMPVPALARILGITEDLLNQILTKLLTYGVASRDAESGVIFNRRMVRDEEIRKKRTDAGKLGGNPVLLNQKPTKAPSKSQPLHEDEDEDEESQSGRGAGEGAGLAERIVAAYPRRDAPMNCLESVRQAIDAGEDPITMLEQVRQCAAYVNGAPGGHSNGKMPSAKTFFSEGRWRQPEVLRDRAADLRATINGGNQAKKLEAGGWTHTQ